MKIIGDAVIYVETRKLSLCVYFCIGLVDDGISRRAMESTVLGVNADECKK